MCVNVAPYLLSLSRSKKCGDRPSGWFWAIAVRPRHRLGASSSQFPMREAAGEEERRGTLARRAARCFDVALKNAKLLAEKSILEQEFRLGASEIESEGECRRRLG